jgi:hypothetical protein
MTKSEALKMALDILESFMESSLYEDYQEEDNWSDEEYEEMLTLLHEMRREAKYVERRR